MTGKERDSLDIVARDARLHTETGQRLYGQPLMDAAGWHLGEIVDAVLGASSGRLQGLFVARGAGEPHYVSVLAGLMHDEGRWTLLEEAPRFRTTLFNATESADTVPDPAEDWMVGQVAARRLVDRQGRTIVEKGQTITAAIVAMASRTGMLHRLEGNPR